MTHKIYPHGRPECLVPGLWRVVGSLPIPMLKRNMFVYLLPEGSQTSDGTPLPHRPLLIHSAVAMEEAGMLALEQLGTPALMVIPHPRHTMDAPFYKERYPSLHVYGSHDAQLKLPALPFDGPPELLETLGIHTHVVPGMKITEVVLELPLEDGGAALLFTDLVNQNLADAGFFMKLLGPPGGGGVARVLKLTQIADSAIVKQFLHTLSATPRLELVAGCHGAVVRDSCASWLEQASERM